MEQLIEAFGRFHPVLVHLPIGFIILLITVEILKLLKLFRMESASTATLWFIAFLSAALSSVAGYFLSKEGGYELDSLTKHQNQGIALTIICLVAFLSKWDYLTGKIGFNSILYVPAILAAGIMVTITGHNGGNLTHGESYLVEKLPAPLRSMLGFSEAGLPQKTVKKEIKDYNEAVVYQDIVKPILEEKCLSCHNPKKMKGELRMDTPDLLLKGGEHGEILVAGKSDESEMIKRMLLPESSDEHMPPKGKPQATADEMEIMKWWIDNGHDFSKKTKELKVTPQIATLFKINSNAASERAVEIAQVSYPEEKEILKKNVPEITEDFNKKVKETGGVISKISKESNLIDITFFSKPGLTDQEFTALGKLPENIIWLNLGNTKTGTETIKTLTALPNLTRLHLEKTALKPESVTELLKLKKIEYLNLNGNPLAEADLKKILSIKTLKSLYVFDTGIPDEKIEELRGQFKNVSIQSGPTKKQIEDFLKIEKKKINDDVYAKKK